MLHEVEDGHAVEVCADHSSWLARRSVRGRLFVLVALGALVTILVAAVGLAGLSRVTRAKNADLDITDAQYGLSQAHASMHAVQSAVLEAVIAAQGSSTLGVAQAETELRAATRELRHALGAATTLDLDDALQQSIAVTRQKYEVYLEQAAALDAVAKTDPAAAAAGLGDFDRSSEQLAANQDRLTARLASASSEAERSANVAQSRAHRRILVLSFLAIMVLAVLAFLLGRTITRSLRRLGQTAASITAGDLDARTDVTGPNELGNLGRALNAMADSLHGLFVRLGDEARRDAFSSQLVEAFELVDTEPDAYIQVQVAMHAISDEFPMELLLADSSQAHVQVVAGHPTQGSPGCPVQTPYTCLAVRRGSAVTFNSSDALNACPKLRDRPGGPCSAVCVPVTFMGRALGVLHVNGPDGRPPSPAELSRLSALAAQTGSTIGTVRATQTTQLQATTDGLTGLINRRTLENELRALRDQQRPFSLAIADCDHFKQINDTYGHEAGDRALRLFAQVVGSNLRDGDIASRYGGEEFVLVFPGQSIDQTQHALQRLRTRLADAQAGGDTPPFTASFGVAMSTPSSTIDEIIHDADNALAIAKREGRDRVVVATEPRTNESVNSVESVEAR